VAPRLTRTYRRVVLDPGRSRRPPPLWTVAAAGGLLAVGSGLLPLPDAGHALARVAPVLLFLVAVTVLAELGDAAGVFDLAAREAAKLARGRTWLLFLLVCLLAGLTTTLLSLDTTAVLLTPVVLALAGQLELNPLPFAMATVWLANTASLLLPVSNLTNLLAVHRLHLTPPQFAARTWPAALLAFAITVGVLLLCHRRALTGRYTPARIVVADRRLAAFAGGSIVLFAGLVLAEVDVTWAACGCAAALVVPFLLTRERRSHLRVQVLPWRLVVLVAGLFAVVEAAHRHGLDRLLTTVAGTGDGLWPLLRLAGTAAAGANLVNNLPAYLALEPVAGDAPARLLALLVGVDAGPLVLVWGSLATLLWRERCAARGLQVGAGSFALGGLLLVPLVLLAAVPTL
jgi:arsenical pump membrane protein